MNKETYNLLSNIEIYIAIFFAAVIVVFGLVFVFLKVTGILSSKKKVKRKKEKVQTKNESGKLEKSIPGPEELKEAVKSDSSAPIISEIVIEQENDSAGFDVITENDVISSKAISDEKRQNENTAGEIDTEIPAEVQTEENDNTGKNDITEDIRDPAVSEQDKEADLIAYSVDSLEKRRNKKKDKEKSDKPKKNKSASAKKKLLKAKKQAKKLKIPKTVQDSIPYYAVYEDSGIIETSKGVFTKSYLLKDVNYQSAKTMEQEDMFQKYGEFLNSFDPTTHFQISIIQNKINMTDFESKVMLKDENDGLDDLRKENNDLVKYKLQEGSNNLSKAKYLTVSLKSLSYEDALAKFDKLDREINSDIKKIGNSSATPVSTETRLEILHDIYNNVEESEFCNNYVLNEKGQFVPAENKFSFKIMRRSGLSTKDMIGPSSMEFKNDYGKLGDKYFRALYLRKLPSYLADIVLRDLTDTDCNMITSMYYEPIDPKDAIKMAKDQALDINTSLAQKQQKYSIKGVSPELISPELRDASEEGQELLHDLTSKNQKLFFATFVIVHFADTKEQLELDTKSIMSNGRSLVCDLKKLTWQQENGLNTALPLAYNQLFIKRSLTTESAAVFMPFVNQELNDLDGGMYYGNNSISGNLILFDRTKLKNGNGFIFGQPGSGKSFAAKLEALRAYISRPNDRVIIVDPEGEYAPLARLLGGEVIRIAPGSDVHINPFDLEMNYKSEDDPMSIKSDFIASLCETISGDRWGITQVQRSIIDRCVNHLYKPFLESKSPETGEYDKSKLPTLVDFYNYLREQRGYDAMQLADGLEMYVTGSFNFFAHRTNVEYTKRFVVYDIKDIGSNMTALGLQIVLDNIWNQVVAGREEGHCTWIFADEIHLLFKTQATATFLRDLFKRARKYGGIPTGITQNVSDLLNNDYVSTIISNCEYVMMLSQAAQDRAKLADMFNMSSTEIERITNANPGEGLIYNGSVMVPFVNKLPVNSKIYKALTTKLSEVKDRENNITTSSSSQK